MFKKNINGIGLVEIMVAMGLLGVLSLGVMSLMNNANKGVKTTDQNLQIAGLLSSTTLIMNDSKSCTSAFGGKPMPAERGKIELDEIVVTTPNGNIVKIIEKAPVTYNGLTVTSIILENTAEFDGPQAGLFKKNIVTLTLEMQKQAGATYGGQKIKRKITSLMISKDSAILECVSGPSSNEKDVCEMTGGIYEEINTPKCHYSKFAVSDDPLDFDNPGKYPEPDLGMYVKHGIKSDGIISSAYSLTPSDRRLKKNIRTIEDALNKTLLLRGVSFEMKKKKFGKSSRIGVIAQEVEKVFPELVMTGADGLKGVEYSNLTAVLIEAIKEQQKQILELQMKIDNLKGDN